MGLRQHAIRLAVLLLPLGLAVGSVGVAQAAPLTTQSLDGGATAEALASGLVGAGVTVTNVRYTGANVAAGSFGGGEGVIGFGGGLVLSSGDIAGVVGPNDSDGTSGVLAVPGDPDLDRLASADGTSRSTVDAAVLEFDFVPDRSQVFFDYVFASEEYDEFVGSPYNDVFGFFVNGTNCAVVGDDPVSVNTVNGGGSGLFGPAPPTNPDSFVSNRRDAAGNAPLDLEMDGLTVVLGCVANVRAGETNQMKLAIADTTDAVYDAAVFIRAGSFTTAPPTAAPPTGDRPPVERFDDPDSGGDVKRVAELVCRFLFPDGAAAEVVLARDDVFADTLAGAALAADQGCILFTPGGPDAPLDPGTRAEIDRVLGDGGLVSIMGGETAVSALAQAELAAGGYQIARYAGPSRIETAVEVAREVTLVRHPGGTTAALAFAGNWPDAVTGGAWAAAIGAPVLLTYTEELHPATAAAMDELGIIDTVVFGGTAVISEAAAAAAPFPERVAGSNRMDSAAQVAGRLWDDGGLAPTALAVVNLEVGNGWALALAASPLSVRFGAPQIGVRADELPTETVAYLEGRSYPAPPEVYVIGGTEVVSNAVASQIAAGVGRTSP